MPGRSGGVPMDPNVIEPLAGAMEKFGKTLQRSAESWSQVFKKMDEAAETERIINTHYKVKDEFMRVAQGFKDRVDYEKFDDDARAEEERIRTTFAGGLRTRREKEAFSRSFGSMASSLRETVFNKKAQVITDNATAAFERTYSSGVDMYIATDDPGMKKAIRTNLEIESAVLVEKGIMRPEQRNVLLDRFEATAEETKVRMIGLKDPMMAREMLDDPDDLTHIDRIKKVQLAEHMETRIRLEGSRIDKLNAAIQRENQANVLDDWALGQLDLDKLMAYRARDSETNLPGLSDAFFSSMLEKVKRGADSITNEAIFNELYTRDGLTLGDVEAEMDSLSTRDERTLMRRVMSEQREEERESRFYRRQAEAEERRVASDEKRIAKERRASWARTARIILTKSMNELGVDVKDGAELLKTFQGYVDDTSIAPEDLPDMVEKLVETKRGGVIKWLKGLYSSWTGEGKEKEETTPEKVVEPKPAPDYGLRPDKTKKGPGFLGALRTSKGEIATEISIGVELTSYQYSKGVETRAITGRTQIPTLVPTLTQKEIDYLLKGGKPTKEIVDKAIEHARKRMSEGKSPFKESEVRPTRKSLDDIFGRKKEKASTP